jgi:hypothetical protein
MNAETKSASARLQRIKVVSRIARYTCFVFLAFVIGFCVFIPLWWADVKANLGGHLLNTLFQIILCVWYWKLTRLFGFYEQGLIFAAGTIRCIKTLGLLCVLGGMVTSASHFIPRHEVPVVTHSTPGAIVTHTTHAFRMGFFSFDFGTGIDFGVLLAGAVIVLIAWIMDEGRKIQEEQELTV